MSAPADPYEDGDFMTPSDLVAFLGQARANRIRVRVGRADVPIADVVWDRHGNLYRIELADTPGVGPQ